MTNAFSDNLDAKAADYIAYIDSWRHLINIDEPAANNRLTILDFGIGKGRPAELLLKFGVGKVIGVDISEEMIQDAVKHDSIEYHLIQKGQELPFPENHFDGAIANYVFLTMEQREDQLQAAKTIYKVLKLNAPLVMLMSNPLTAGTRFKTYLLGEEGETYSPSEDNVLGLEIPLTLFDLEGNIVFQTKDFLWSPRHYRNILYETGFSTVHT
jgi:SAM-dependent methyltransferase